MSLLQSKVLNPSIRPIRWSFFVCKKYLICCYLADMNNWRIATALAFLELGSLCAAVSSVGPGYTAGYGDQQIYLIDFQTGASFVVTTIPGSNPADIALLNNNTAYVLGGADGNIYSINLQNNTYSKVTPIPLPVGNTLYDLALASDRTAYVTSQEDLKKVLKDHGY